MNKIKEGAFLYGNFRAYVEYEYEKDENEYITEDNQSNAIYKAFKKINISDLDFDYDIADIIEVEE